MLTVLSHRFKNIILFSAVLLGVSVMPFAHADATDSCFSFLNAQDYVRAATEAKGLVKRKGLSREEQRYAYVCHGAALFNQGKMKEALPSWRKVEELSNSTRELLSAYQNLGVIYYKLGDFDRAELYAQRNRKVALELNDKSGEANALNSLAMVAQERGDVDSALTLFEQAVSTEPNEAQQATMMSNIATIYSNRKEYPKASEMLRKGIEIARRHGDGHEIAIFQINLGELLTNQGDLSAAEKELTDGYNAIHLLGDKGWEAEACNGLVVLASAQGNNALVIEWAKKAEGLYREIGYTGRANVYAKALAGKRGE